MLIKKAISLKTQAYQQILEAILRKELQQDFIYSEQWFADRYQISRTPVREALLQLRTEGLIEVLPNRGVIIKPLTFEDARNIIQTRIAIEGFCSAHLASNAGEACGKAALERIEAVLEKCYHDFNRTDELQFHMEIIQFTHNTELINQFNRLRTKIDIYWENVMEQPGRAEEIYREHKKILDCMKAGDASGAYRASAEHLTIVLQKLQSGTLFEGR